MLQLEGNPIWFDLATPDPQGAKEFYTGLFGWEWADVPMSDGSTYHMAIRGDVNIAGMFAEHTSKSPTGIWVNRICVDDAEKKQLNASRSMAVRCFQVQSTLMDGALPRLLQHQREQSLVCGRT